MIQSPLRFALIALTSTAFLGVDTSLQAAPPATPDLHEIIRQVVARDDANEKQLKTLQYHQHIVNERIDDHAAVTQHQEMDMIVRPGATPEIQVLSEKGDHLPSDPDEATKQADGQKAHDQQVRIALRDMVQRFQITLAGTDTLLRQPVYILDFAPKPDQPYHNQTEKVLNHLRGRIWVHQRDYTILQTEATLAEPVSVAWVFAKVTDLTFHYALLSGPGSLGPAEVKTSVRVDVPLMTIRQRSIAEMTRFEPRSLTVLDNRR